MDNRNGFAEALEQLNTIVKVNEDVAMDVLEDVADYFAQKLKGEIPTGTGDVHLKEQVIVKVHREHVSVEFHDKGWYWYLAEHGHKKAGGKGRVKGLHFVRNTLDAERVRIEQMLLQQIVNKMEGN